MSFEGTFLCCVFGALALFFLGFAVFCIVKMRRDRAAHTRSEQQQAQILRHLRQAALNASLDREASARRERQQAEVVSYAKQAALYAKQATLREREACTSCDLRQTEILLYARLFREARTLVEQQQEEILRRTKQAADNTSTVADGLLDVLALTEKRVGEPLVSDAIGAVYRSRDEVLARMAEVEDMSSASAGVVARAIATALPHLRRFSEWHGEWKSRARLADVKRQLARASGYQRVTPPGSDAPDPPEELAPQLGTKPKDSD